jgi:hypothetical protein
MTDIMTINLTVGELVHFAGDPQPWAIRATSEHFAVAVRHTTEADRLDSDPDFPEFDDDFEVGEVMYTVLDWHNSVRGPCNLVGQGYGDGEYLPSECERMLAEFEAGDLEVSHRNRVRLAVEVAR